MKSDNDQRSGMRRRTGVQNVTHQVTTQAKKTAKVLQALDAFPKVNEDYAQHTNMGAAVSIICLAICSMLFVSEVIFHRTTLTKSVLSVDTKPLPTDSSTADKMNIYLDIEFPRLACSLITLDTSEVSGERQLDIHDGHIMKRRLNKEGEPIEPAKKDKVNKFSDLRDSDEDHNQDDPSKNNAVAAHNPMNGIGGFGILQALMLQSLAGRGGNVMDLFQDQFPEGIDKAFRNEKEEGCEVVGYLEVNRVAGQFHISPGKSLMIGGVSIQLAVQTANLNLTHTIKRLAFGEGFPGAVNPLDGESRVAPAAAVHQYFLKVVPTTFVPLKGGNMSTNQYSVTESVKTMPPGHNGMVQGGGKTPGVYFTYELSPIRVSYAETRASLGEFLTSLCAIIGGVFSVSGLIHSVILGSSKMLKKKKVGSASH